MVEIKGTDPDARKVRSPAKRYPWYCKECGREDLGLTRLRGRLMVPFHVDWKLGQRCPTSGRRLDE